MTTDFIICRCGHTKEVHGFAGPPIGDEWCDGGAAPSICPCYCYVPDNLAHIEYLAKHKNLL